MSAHLGSIVGILICLILSAFFSSAETAYTSFNRAKMKTLATDGNKKANLALKHAENYDKLLSTILVGNNIVNILMSSLATVLFIKLLLDTPANSYASAISTGVITVVVLIFGEITPKSLAKDFPEAIAMAYARPLKLLAVILSPINAFFMLWKKLISKIFKAKNVDTVTEGEVLTLIDEAHEDGSIDEYNKELIENIFDFDDITAGEIATHRTDLIMLSSEDSTEEWDDAINNSRFSRYPVYGEQVDDIVGILDARAYLRLEDKSRDNVFATAIKSPYFVPQNVKADVLFRNMKNAKESLAVVLDEYGGTIGVVTMNDLIECLVGEFNTEDNNTEDTTPEFEQISDDTWVIRGDALITDVIKKTGAKIPEDEGDTLSGYILGLKGEIPVDGTTFEMETETVTIKALVIKDHMIEKVELLVKSSDEENDEDEKEKKLEHEKVAE